MKGKSRKLANSNPSWVVIACGTTKERTRWRQALQDNFTVLEVDGRSSPKRLIAKLNSPVVLLDFDLQQPGRINALPAIKRLRHLAESMLIPGTQVIHKGKLGARSNVIHQLPEEVAPLNERPHQDSGSPYSSLALLTPRKREIAQLIATGASNKQIADHLHISEATVKAQLTNIFRILHLSGRLQLALFLTKQVH